MTDGNIVIAIRFLLRVRSIFVKVMLWLRPRLRILLGLLATSMQLAAKRKERT